MLRERAVSDDEERDACTLSQASRNIPTRTMGATVPDRRRERERGRMEDERKRGEGE